MAEQATVAVANMLWAAITADSTPAASLSESTRTAGWKLRLAGAFLYGLLSGQESDER